MLLSSRSLCTEARDTMVKQSLLKTKQRHICQRCGGQLIRFYDTISCLQCGAPHTEEGKLVSMPFIQRLEASIGRTVKYPD